MPKFRKKAFVIEARQWTGENFEELYQWGRPSDVKEEAKIVWAGPGSKPKSLAVATWKGWSIAEKGDWIIRDTAGTFHSFKPDLFEAIYEPVS